MTDTSTNTGAVDVDQEKKDAALEDLIHKLRGFAQAYPENIFTPLTLEETEAHSMIVTRASAGMGRHLAKFFDEAAAALETIQREAHHWKSSHDNQVAKAALLAQRPDLPVDRIPAYREVERLQSEVETLRAELADAIQAKRNMSGLLDAALEQNERMKAELEEARRDSGAKQAEIDRLMLEYCPDEMTEAQKAEWAAHQRPARQQAASDKKQSDEEPNFDEEPDAYLYKTACPWDIALTRQECTYNGVPAARIVPVWFVSREWSETAKLDERSAFEKFVSDKAKIAQGGQGDD